MLTFYPEFEADAEEEVEAIFLLDVSNSMSFGAHQQARKVDATFSSLLGVPTF